MEKKVINLLSKEIKEVLQTKYAVEINEINFEKPADIKNGNLSSNLCLKNCKQLGKSPMEIGEFLQEVLTGNKYIEKIEIVKPGFLNFYYSREYFIESLEKIQKEQFKEFSTKEDNINVEFVSANPTGKLHLGHARNGVFGDSLANVLERVGYKVKREYYINDAGVQMENLGHSVRAFYLEFCGEKLNFPEKGYRGAEILEIAKKLYEHEQDNKKTAPLEFFIEYGYQANMKAIKELMTKLNIKFDHYASEKFYHENKLVEKALMTLSDNQEIYTYEGAKWLKTTKYLDDKDRVLEKSDGTHTYLTSDIAYHADKIERGSNLLIDVWGGDHHGYVARVKSAIRALGYKSDQLEIVLIQMVSIFNGDEKVKMSKRAGTSVTIDDLLEIVSIDVLRYFFIMRSPDTQLDFNLETAAKENSDNPVFYIQYAHARISKILTTHRSENREVIKMTPKKFSDLDVRLIDFLGQYKKTLEEAANVRRPHLIANFIYELAGEFHKYYNAEKILSDDLEMTQNKITIITTVKEMLADGLSLLGIAAKNQM